MERRLPLIRLWVSVALIVAIIALALAPSFRRAWRCCSLAESGEFVEAELVGKDADVGLILEVASGSQRGRQCTLSVNDAGFERAELGDVMEVVVRPDRPGECILASSVRASRALLNGLLGVSVILVLLIVLAGSYLHRSLTASPRLTSHLDVDPQRMTCPRCADEMSEGYVPLMAGLSWRTSGEPVGVPHALTGLPGTVGWRGRPRLHAYRCERCEVITMKYGKGLLRA